MNVIVVWFILILFLPNYQTNCFFPNSHFVLICIFPLTFLIPFHNSTTIPIHTHNIFLTQQPHVAISQLHLPHPHLPYPTTPPSSPCNLTPSSHNHTDCTATYHCSRVPVWEQDTIFRSCDRRSEHIRHRVNPLEPDDDFLTQACSHVAFPAEVTALPERGFCTRCRRWCCSTRLKQVPCLEEASLYLLCESNHRMLISFPDIIKICSHTKKSFDTGK